MKLPAKIAAFEFDGDEVRAAVVKTGGRKTAVLEVHARRAVYTDPGERRAAIVQATREVLELLKSRPAMHTLCVNCQNSVVRSLAIPFRGARRVSAAVAFELEPYLAVPIDDLVVAHCPIREVEGQTEVLAVGIRRTLLEEQVAILSEAGVNPEGIGLDAAGLTGLWLEGRRVAQGLRAVLHVRESSSILCIVYNRNLAFIRPLPIPAARLHEDPQAVAPEVRNSLRAFLATWRGEDAIAELAVTGVDMSMSERERFEEVLSIPVTYEDISQNLKGAALLRSGEVPLAASAPDAAENAPEPALRECPNYWEAAAGVAVASAGFGTSFEFRKGPLASPGSMRGLVLHAAFSAGLLGLVLIGTAIYCMLDYRQNMAQIARNGEEIWKIFSETFPDSEMAKSGRLPSDLGGIQTIGFMQGAHNKALSEGTNLPVDVLTRPNFLDILREIGEKLPGDKIRVTDVKIRDSRGQDQSLTILGEVDDVAALNQAYEGLKQSTLLKVEDEPIRQRKPNGQTTFTIVASI